MSQSILAYLQGAERGATVDEIRDATGLTGEAVGAALAGLARCGWLIGIPRPDRSAKYYPVTRIGECDWCGLIDHHLVAGMCPACMNRSGGLDLVPSGPMRTHLLAKAGIEPRNRSRA